MRYLPHTEEDIAEMLRVVGVHLADSGTEHDRLDPLPAFSGGEAQPERAGESLDDGLPELVPVVGCTVARLDLDVQA